MRRHERELYCLGIREICSLRQLVLCFTCFTSLMLGQSHPGARYGARDPRTCSSTKDPAKGAPSPAQAAQYVTCNAEHVSGDMLFLAENVKVEIGRARRYNPNDDLNMNDVDPSQPVYPIRGSLTGYGCNPVDNSILHNAGKNCLVTRQPNAKGLCYKTTFGDWKCSLFDINPEKEFNQPPPR